LQQGLFNKLKKHFVSLDARVVLCLSQLVVGLIKLRTVNLSELCLVVGLLSDRKESKYRRLQRFFSRAKIDTAIISQLMMQMFSGESVVLCLDRTNWMFGKSNINILVLAIAYKNIAIPIMWSFLDHKGNSNYEQRVWIIQRFINLFGKDCIKVLLADREFVGDKWLQWLDSQMIPFVIRVRENMKIGRVQGELTTANHLVHGLKPGETIALKDKRRITQNYAAIKLYIAACRNAKGELVVVVTNSSPEGALDLYKLRWEIESLFGCLKTRGFNFESTHITSLHKIDTMLSVLTIAFSWAYKIGEWRNEIVPIKLKRHLRRSVSIFRYGLDFLRNVLFKPNYRHQSLDLIDIWIRSANLDARVI
jgi:Transposase DDE domain